MRTKTAPAFPGHEVRQYSRLSGGQPSGKVWVNVDTDKHGVTWVSMDMLWTSPQLRRYNVTEVQTYLRIADGDQTALEVMLTRGRAASVLRVQPDVPNGYGQAAGDDVQWTRANQDLLCNVVYELHVILGQSSLLASIIVADLEQVMHAHAGLWRAACKYALAMAALTDEKT